MLPSLACPRLAYRVNPVFEDARLQPFPDQADYAQVIPKPTATPSRSSPSFSESLTKLRRPRGHEESDANNQFKESTLGVERFFVYR
jgi:hypothetical protein